MAMTADSYLNALFQLLPPGWVYPRTLSGTLADTLKALAEELVRVDVRVDDLLDEADPRTTLEMLTDWEDVCGLTPSSDSLMSVRRNTVVNKLRYRGGQSRTYFIAVAASLGYSITITEFRPYTCITPIDQGIYNEECRFVWQVNAPETTIVEATCENPCNEPLRSWGNEALEAAIRYLKPAHTTVIFSYGG